MNAVLVTEIDELEDYRVNWESHGWDSDNQSIMTADSASRLQIEDAKKKAFSMKREVWDEVKERLDLSFLTNEEEEIPEWLAAFWYIHFPIDAHTSRKIAQLSMRMPKDNVESLVYPFVPLIGSKKKFFDALSSYGKGHGLSVVGGELFAGARAGDPRAVKMYMEMMSVLEESREVNKGVMLELVI